MFKRDTSETLCVSLLHVSVAFTDPNTIISFFPEEEKELAQLVMTFARHGFPFTELKLRKLAYELAKANRRKGFSPEKKIAGKWWLKGFLQRYKELKKKNAKNLSIHRSECANAYQVAKFFQLYQSLLL